MTTIRLLQCKPDGRITFRETTSSDIPAYAILSHTWGEEEVTFQDMEAGADVSKTVGKAGWKKIQFCAKQTAADGLQYFWVDTCCIDKKNAVELGAAINSMFRWYQNAARCYVYLADVNKTVGNDNDSKWKAALRASRWFTRGWTLQELIAPQLVDFFSSEGERLGSKSSLESEIHGITGIAKGALRGNSLSSFTIEERRSWAANRNTTVEEDQAYCLIGMFDISMVLNYGETKDQAFRRLEEKIQRLEKGIHFEKFTVGLNLNSVPEAAQFVAREDELLKMHDLLRGRPGRSAVVLHGLGGIGKTQLAVEYIRKHKEKHTAIFWLNANDENSLRLSFRGVAHQIQSQLPATEVLLNVDLDRDLDQVVSAVKAWLNLRDNTRWLMVYDNYDNPRTANNSDSSAVDIRRFLPESDHGSVIITTRSASVILGKRLHVEKLTGLEHGLQILSNTSGREGIEDDPDAKALATKLDGLPLALSTAGTYLEHVTTSFAEYLHLYEASWSKLLKTSPKLNSYEDRSLYSTWQITFDRIQKQNAASAMLLKLWAYFDNQDLWFELLQPAHDLTEDETIRTFTEDKMSFNEAVRLLCEFGLVHAAPSPKLIPRSGGYGMHSCVHSWTISVLNNMWDSDLATLTLGCLFVSIANSANISGFFEQRFLQHVARHQHFLTNDMVYTQEIRPTLKRFGAMYECFGMRSDAEFMYLQASKRYQSVGPANVEFHDKLITLGSLYEIQEKFSASEAMYQLALQGCDEDGTHLKLELDILDRLGRLYTRQSKLSDARAVYARALQKCETVNGPEHPDTLAIATRTCDFCIRYGVLSEAETMCIRLLSCYRKKLGPKHHETLNTAYQLSVLYQRQGKQIESQDICKWALQEYGDAPDIAGFRFDYTHVSALVLFGNLFEGAGRIDTARMIFTHALTGLTATQGPSSNLCRRLQGILDELSNPSTEPMRDGPDSSDIIAAESTAPKHKRRKIT